MLAMANFFTSDHHFGHANILVYQDAERRNEDGEPFQHVHEMDVHLIAQWNATVGPHDTVYCLGDFSYMASSSEQALQQMNGKKILVCGNHDPFFKLMQGTSEQKEHAHDIALQCGFSELYWQHTIEIKGVGQVKLAHFPYVPLNDAAEDQRRYLELRPEPTGENLLLHGHVHSHWKYQQDAGKPLMINVGIDVWGLRPVSENDLVSLFHEAGRPC
ncbi:hypothetical protein GALL_254610 [mine drainage metagenome]|uniref:Calcineurin-like phosphoesterase domain-containing protein n=1 Tax=mine drainage metagenome TaxID=410659 RepID=A0A1J5R9C8_9ZZZZ